jgi:hypothetical protein
MNDSVSDKIHTPNKGIDLMPCETQGQISHGSFKYPSSRENTASLAAFFAA